MVFTGNKSKQKTNTDCVSADIDSVFSSAAQEVGAVDGAELAVGSSRAMSASGSDCASVDVARPCLDLGEVWEDSLSECSSAKSRMVGADSGFPPSSSCGV